MKESPHRSAVHEMANRLTGRIFEDDAHRILYATDSSIYRCEPAGVFRPREEEDLIEGVRLAARYGVPFLPRGAGTSLSGQCATPGLVCELTRFDSIRIDPENATATVGPGAIIDAIDRAAAPHGLRYGPAPASSNRATIAGLIANNGTGARSIKFGMAVEQVLEARVLLSDGTIRTFRGGDLNESDSLDRKVLGEVRRVENSIRWPKTWRNASGLNLRLVEPHASLLPLFSGSEGTLGIILEARIKLHPLPSKTQLALFYYDSIVEAMEAVPSLLETGPSAVELMDRTLMELAGKSPNFKLELIKEIPEAILVVEYEDKDGASEALGLGAKRILDDPREQAEVWHTRKEGLGILMSRRSIRRPIPFVEDCAVPVEMLPEYVARLDEIILKHGTQGAYYAHASAGCLHTRPILDLYDDADREAMNAITEETVDLLAELGGTLTGEHGDGRSKRPWHDRFFGRELVEAFDVVRNAFDPIGIFAPKLEGELRYDRPIARRIPERFDWNDGFALELDRCNGEAACRKLEGVMCPSFQPSGDEFLTTRGRANLLRSWMAGEEVEEAIDETLSKCLGCKACAHECPSQVDMANFKAQYRSMRPARLKDHFFGNLDRLARLGSHFGTGPDWLVKRIVGIHPNRDLPSPLRRRFSATTRSASVTEADVLLFSDCHIEYFEHGIGNATLRVLDRLGVKVAVVRGGCCGRPAHSRGLLDYAEKQLAALRWPAEKPVIVVEPSCLSMLKDDAPLFFKGAPTANYIGLEKFLLRHKSSLTEMLSKIAGDLTVHTHCHQKAMGGASEVVELMGLLGKATHLQAGCCGMAGSFGYERNNYPLSLAIAEDRFLPGLRKAQSTGSAICLPGRSCREQATASGMKASHPVELLANALLENH